MCVLPGLYPLLRSRLQVLRAALSGSTTGPVLRKVLPPWACGILGGPMPLTKTVEVRIDTVIARPAADVWAVVSDFERLPEWLDEFQVVTQEAAGPPAEGAVFRYVIDPWARRGTVALTGWIPGKRLAWDGPPLGMTMGAARPRGSFEVVDAGDGGSRFVSIYRPELHGTAVLLAPILTRWLR